MGRVVRRRCDAAGEKQGMKALLLLVLQGPDKLAQDRRDSTAGAAKEGAVLAALQLLRSALEEDMEVVESLKATQQNGASVKSGISCSEFCRVCQAFPYTSHPSQLTYCKTI